MDLAREAYGAFLIENALYSGQEALRRGVGFATLTMFEEEIIAMALEILSAPSGAVGNTTSGGTESIILAVKAARDWAREHRRVPGTPELVVPRTAHPAFNKAADFMDLTVKRVPQGPDYRADVAAKDAAISENTILMVGSAPCYPFGVIDPITELAAVAKNRGIWLHVDACVGGYQANFARKLGYPVPAFDLGVDGVWSLSADLHKYGFVAKGISTIFYREAALKDFATFKFDDWTYGAYSTATMGGSRSGGTQAAAWAVMKNLGEERVSRRRPIHHGDARPPHGRGGGFRRPPHPRQAPYRPRERRLGRVRHTCRGRCLFGSRLDHGPGQGAEFVPPGPQSHPCEHPVFLPLRPRRRRRERSLGSIHRQQRGCPIRRLRLLAEP
jgi:glutamate/tyrosine decarboxylase-like PLP-dependent enzyme